LVFVPPTLLATTPGIKSANVSIPPPAPFEGRSAILRASIVDEICDWIALDDLFRAGSDRNRLSHVTWFEFDFDGVDDSDLHTYAGADRPFETRASTVTA